MAEGGSGLAIVKGVVKAIALAVGLVTTLVCLMATVGRFTDNGWIRLGVALVVAIAVPAVLSDRLLPDDEAPKANGLVGDVFALTWLGFGVAFAVGLGSVTAGLLVKEGDRLVSSGLPALGRVAYGLGGVTAAAPAAAPELPSGAASASAAGAPSAAPPPSASEASSAAPPPSAAPPEPKPKPSGELTPAELFKKLAPAVVSIAIKVDKEQEVGGGTGFLIDTAGTIVTNHHVIRGAEALRIKFINGAVYEEIELLMADPALDLALLAISLSKPARGDRPKDLKPVDLGDSETIEVGERAISIGNPLGLDHTLTDGLVSARRLYEGRQWIQMSVPVSPGNSGGPLFNMKGKVIGVTTAQIGGFMGRAQNLNLAIPVNVLKQQLKPSYPDRRKFGESGRSTHW
ncbi:MAG: trypsin-like peptidase domain-containing protein [Polyangiaceae bacterium]|nr:trypsin-like peptidase domain-containing protein [Polyangiaceae bacterium]